MVFVTNKINFVEDFPAASVQSRYKAAVPKGFSLGPGRRLGWPSDIHSIVDRPDLKINPRALRIAGVASIGLIFGLIMWLLYREIHHIDVRDVMAHVRAISSLRIGVAALLTALSYMTLTCYDYFGLRYAAKPLPLRKTVFASFVSYVFSHNIGLSLFGSLAFRYRIYSAFGLSAVDVTKVALFCGVTFWLGLLTVGGVMLAGWPPPPLAFFPAEPWAYRAFGGTFLLVAATYLVLCARGGQRLRLLKWEFPLPPLRLALIQYAIAALDWLLASGTLYVLMPDNLPVNWMTFVSLFAFAAVAVAVAHVPAGLGVIETIMLAAFAGTADSGAILGSLLVFRAIYYLVPLVLAFVWMSLFELGRASGFLHGAAAKARVWFDAIIPRIFSILAFTGGIILLLSGALPATYERRLWLAQKMPLAFVELTHVLASITGALLLIVARGLQRRLDGAYVLTCGLLSAGIVFSLAKGMDYEEAMILTAALLLLVPCRSYFYRKASLLDQRFSLGWLLATFGALMSMMWLGWFANMHIEYRDSLWWTFTFSGDAPRALRGGLAAVASVLVLAVIYLLRPSRVPMVSAPCGLEALAIIKQSPCTYANLALLQDKSILINAERNAFIMYGTEGRSWVAMGDPVGPEHARQELIWSFIDLVDRYHGWPVFYQIDLGNLRLYVEAGLALLKIGEEAQVDLPEFTLTGRNFKALRNVMNRLGQAGWQLEVLPASAVDVNLPELRRISNAWLGHKEVKEKYFSLGNFDADYLRYFPLAVIRRADQIVCFANLWMAEDKSELSVDLMRFGPDAPTGVMDFMMVSLMQWGQAAGYQRFNLGMAPFSGLESRPLAPLWSRLGAKLFERGEGLYNFQGLRDYKDKFAPKWQPKYLASPPGGQLPYILANIATLINGSIKGVITR